MSCDAGAVPRRRARGYVHPSLFPLRLWRAPVLHGRREWVAPSPPLHALWSFIAQSAGRAYATIVRLAPNTYQAPVCQEAHVSRALGLIGSRECSSENPRWLSVP